MDSCSGSSLPQLLLAQSPISVQSEDNTLAKEFQAMETQRLLQTESNAQSSPPPALLIANPANNEYGIEMMPLRRSSPQDGENTNNNNDDENGNNSNETNEVVDEANLTNSNTNLLIVNGNESEYDNAKLMLLEFFKFECRL